jgi:hypothetical protein
LYESKLAGGGAKFLLGEWPITPASFDSYKAFAHSVGPESSELLRAIDCTAATAIVTLGYAHVVVAIARKRFVQRTTVIVGLTLLATVTLRHAFFQADAGHVAASSTPAVVLLVALCAGGASLRLRWRRGRAVPAGALVATALPVGWLLQGAATPLNARLARMASGEERPSFGEPYRYDDLPRAGDVFIGDQHLKPVRYVRAHSSASDPVLCTTWLLGGGVEAFLSQRRNPIAFDKSDEILTPEQRYLAWSEFTHDPPALIVGNFFDYYGDDLKWEIQQGWHTTFTDYTEIRIRNR